MSLAAKRVEKESITVEKANGKIKGSWDDGACVDWSAIPRAAVKQNPNIKCCHCRFRCSMFCLATTGTGVTGGDSRSMVCEGCGCVGGE